MNNTQRMPAVFVSHGGGPLPLLGDPAHAQLVDNLRHIAGMIPIPSAIVMISAHWEASNVRITGGAAPTLIYDYSGFAPEAYEIRYPAKGHPQLASQLQNLLLGHDIKANIDDQRGFDHGMYVPLKLMYPDVDIPCVQLSLLHSLDAAAHIQMGQALASLREQNILIIGSGFSFHNLREFFAPTSTSTAQNLAFEAWLSETCLSSEITESERSHRLIHWQDAPGARFCHPREEHLLPLHVCYGCAGTAASHVFPFDILGKRASCFLW